MEIYNKKIDELFEQFDSSDDGLSNSQYQAHLEKYGKNTVKVKGTPLYKKVLEPFANVFMVILIAAIIISLFQHETLDAFVIFIIVMASAVLSYVQNFSTSRILKSLQKHAKQVVQVARNDVKVQVDSELIVPGDVFYLNEGDKVPVDARVLHSEDLRCDESILTGESAPVSKHSNPLTHAKEIYEQSNMIFQGTFVVGGRVKALAVATGNYTESGKLAKLSVSTASSSPTQQKINKIVSQIVVVVFATALITLGLSIYRGIGIEESIRFVLSLTVSAVPEGLPVAVSVVLVVGMHRMAKKRSLVRNMSAIESIGITTLIATDKTGTLTKNKLTVQDVWQFKDRDLKSTSQILIESVNSRDGIIYDPLDQSLTDFAKKYTKTDKDREPYRSFPFDISLSMSGNVWRTGDTYKLVVKGAPEKVIEKCGLSNSDKAMISKAISELTGQAYRVIALAYYMSDKPINSLKDVDAKHLKFEALIGVADELRSESKTTIQKCLAAGVKVCMITGDHFETAFAIGKQLGLVENRDQVFDARKIRGLPDQELQTLITDVRVFSRVVPEDKFRLLELFKKHEITAMTGDGVNDVPALTSANIGIAIGSGSQIAKDASDIIILDSNFKSIATAIKEGRQIYDNIRRMLFYLLSTNLGEVIISIGSLIVGLPLPLLPLQILWVNIVTDTCLVVPLGLEPPSGDVMDSPPRRVNKPIIGRRSISRLLVIAFAMAATGLAVFAYFINTHTTDYARSITFAVVVTMQWANAFNARNEWKSLFSKNAAFNMYFVIGLLLAFTLQMAALFGPLQGVLHLVPIDMFDMIIASLGSFGVIILADEVFKLFYKKAKQPI